MKLKINILLLIVITCCIGNTCHASRKQSIEFVKTEIERCDSLYRRQQYIMALDGYISQLSYAHSNNSDSLYLLLLSRIGSVYNNYSDYGRAFYYYEKVLSDPKASRYEDIISKLFSKMVVGYYNIRDLDKAKEYYNLQLAHPIKNDTLNEYYRYSNGGLIQKMQNRPKETVEMFRNALILCENKNMKPEFKVPVMLEISDAFNALDKPDSAYLYLSKACDIAEKENLESYAADCYNMLYRYYKGMGDTDRAARFLELYATASDSIDQHTRLDMASIRLLQSHDVHAREEISSLNAKIDFQTKTLILCILFCTILIALVIYTRLQHHRLKTSYRLLIAKNDEIFELEQQSTTQSVVETDIRDQVDDNPLFERIDAAMNNIDLISQPSFSLSELSKEVGSNSKYVSSLINMVYKKNFRTVLNERRIREATKRLSDPQHYGNYSIADIAESLGYGSSTVFINAFKKVIGMTPAVYRRYSKSK